MLISSSSSFSTQDTFTSLLSQISPWDQLEENHLQDTLLWIKSGAPLFRIAKPDIPNKHLVSYFILWDEEVSKILLVDHIKSGLWLPAGGHVEVEENPQDTARRECKEELGIDALFWKEAPVFLTSTQTVGLTAGHTDVSLWYVLHGHHTAFYKFDTREFKNIQWFDFENIPYTKSDPHMQRFIHKFKSML